MSRIIGPLSNSVDQQVDEVMAGLGEGPHHSNEGQRTSEQAMPRIIGPLSNSVDQQVDELMAGLGEGSHHSDEDESFETFTGGTGFGAGHGLMDPKKFLNRPRHAYTVTVGDYRHQSQVAGTRLTAAVTTPSASVKAAPFEVTRD